MPLLLLIFGMAAASSLKHNHKDNNKIDWFSVILHLIFLCFFLFLLIFVPLFHIK